MSREAILASFENNRREVVDYKGTGCAFNYFHTAVRRDMHERKRDEDRVKSSRPIPFGRGVVALHTSTANGDYRGSPRCTWRLGGKAISWEKGAGVTRPTPWRTSEPLHAHARTCARGCMHAYARVEHVVTVVVGVREGRLEGKG